MQSATEKIQQLRKQSAIRKIRKRLGFSQPTFANLAGVSQSHLSLVERFLAEPGENLHELIDELHAYIHEAEDVDPALGQELHGLIKQVLRERLRSNNSGKKYLSRKR